LFFIKSIFQRITYFFKNLFLKKGARGQRH
jgi:hypothetical protein